MSKREKGFSKIEKIVIILVGVSLSYLAVIPRWLDELQRFQDEVQQQHMEEQKRAEVLKTFNGA